MQSFFFDISSTLNYFSSPKTELTGWRRILLFIVLVFITIIIFYHFSLGFENLPFLVFSCCFFCSFVSFVLSYIQIIYYDDFFETDAEIIENQEKTIRNKKVFSPVYSYELKDSSMTGYDYRLYSLKKFKIGKKAKVLVNLKNSKDLVTERKLWNFLYIALFSLVLSILCFLKYYTKFWYKG